MARIATHRIPARRLGAVGLSLLMVLVFALAMPANARSDGGSPVSEPVGGQARAEIQHLGETEPATVAGFFGGQARAEIQHLGETEPATATNFEPARRVSPSSGGRELEIILLTGTLALVIVGGLLWSRRLPIRAA
jgi:hypothetical protein